MTVSSANYMTIPGLKATSTLAASQWKIVKFSSTAGEVKLASASTDNIAGVVMNDPAAGEAAEVAVFGVVKALTEASVAAGDHVTCSTTGRVKTTTTSNDHVLGIAIEAAGAAGDLIRVAVAISNY